MLRAWHSPKTGCLHVCLGRKIPAWFRLTVFAAPPDITINDGWGCIEISIAFGRFYKVFHINTNQRVSCHE